uniref:Uncharacterized protein n=1 Tax=Pipistrellus kuhlii TaxID=59472 RepID=A0A7J7V0U6_PIPKU|nr:hypothetical protein mPipKuh1_008609 [Pipistrellus kuhlii]
MIPWMTFGPTVATDSFLLIGCLSDCGGHLLSLSKTTTSQPCVFSSDSDYIRYEHTTSVSQTRSFSVTLVPAAGTPSFLCVTLPFWKYKPEVSPWSQRKQWSRDRFGSMDRASAWGLKGPGFDSG